MSYFELMANRIAELGVEPVCCIVCDAPLAAAAQSETCSERCRQTLLLSRRTFRAIPAMAEAA